MEDGRPRPSPCIDKGIPGWTQRSALGGTVRESRLREAEEPLASRLLVVSIVVSRRHKYLVAGNDATCSGHSAASPGVVQSDTPAWHPTG